MHCIIFFLLLQLLRDAGEKKDNRKLLFKVLSELHDFVMVKVHNGKIGNSR